MDYEFDYYLIGEAGEPSVPLLKNNDEVDPKGTKPISFKSPVELDSPIYLAINPPYPAKPNFNVDLLILPSAVYSQKIYDVLAPLNIKNYQLLPGIIVDRKGEEHKNFWLEHAYHRISCIDTEKSNGKFNSFTKMWRSFESIVLREELLKEVPLEERLIFRPMETRQFVLYHKSIVDAIMAVKPVNISFMPIVEWHEGVQLN